MASNVNLGATAWPTLPQLGGEAKPPPEALTFLLPAALGRITGAERINADTRNPVYRLHSHKGSTAIAKWFLPELDRFYASRFRREEKVLALLNYWFYDHVPARYAGIISQEYGLLLEQDVGESTFDEALRVAYSESEKYRLTLAAIEFLANFHRVTFAHFEVFRRTIYSTDLDRLTTQTFLRRARIGLGRLSLLEQVLSGQMAASEATALAQPDYLEKVAKARFTGGFFTKYGQLVVAPLVQAPAQILHNSYSPSHLIVKQHLYLIDFETVSVGAAQLDLAEFVGAPELMLTKERQLELVSAYYELGDNGRQPPWSQFLLNFYNAMISRSIDYAGTVALRCIRGLSLNEPAKADLYLEKVRQYQSSIVKAIESSHGRALPFASLIA